MDIIRNLVDANKYNIKCPYEMNGEFYIVHNTANDAPARNEVEYMKNNNNQVSFHYAIDDIEIVQGIEENRNSWNCGDGKSGKGNRKGISIEICYSKSGGEKFIKSELNAVKFIAQGLKSKGWGIDRVKKHQDFNGKYCPHRTLDMGWERFLNMIKEELGQPMENKVKEPTQTNENEHIDIFNDGKINCIYDIQEYLNRQYGANIAQDNIFGQATKKALVKALQTEFNKQYNAGLVVDGIYGTKTRGASKIVRKNAEGNITMLIQMALFIKGYDIDMDKKFGDNTEKIVLQFQKDNGLVADGIVGANTFEKLFG